MSNALTITLPEPLAGAVRAAALARGLSAEAFVHEEVHAALLSAALGWGDEDTTGDDAAFAEFQRTGVGVPGEEVLAWLRSLPCADPLPEPQARPLK